MRGSALDRKSSIPNVQALGGMIIDDQSRQLQEESLDSLDDGSKSAFSNKAGPPGYKLRQGLQAPGATLPKIEAKYQTLDYNEKSKVGRSLSTMPKRGMGNNLKDLKNKYIQEHKYNGLTVGEESNFVNLELNEVKDVGLNKYFKKSLK